MPCGSDTTACTACYFRRRPVLTLRGLCSDSIFDDRYTLTKEYSEGKPIIRGYFRTTLAWTTDGSGGSSSDGNGSWRLTSLLSNTSYASLNSKSSSTYPFGRQEWTVFKDGCASGEDRPVNLTLTTCTEGMFTCDSGDCIDLDKVSI